MNALTTLTQVPTGNGEPDLFRDAQGRAYWADGSRVTVDDVVGLEGAEVLRDVLRRTGLTVLDARAPEFVSATGRELTWRGPSR